MKSKILITIITAAMVFSAGHVKSQPPPPPPPPDSSSAPVDSGSLALLIAAGYYGYAQIKKKPEKGN